MDGDRIHPVSLELIGKAKELASVIQAPVYCLLIGNRVKEKAEELLYYGIERVFLYNQDVYKRQFQDTGTLTEVPDKEGHLGFEQFMARFREGLYIERAAVKYLKV